VAREPDGSLVSDYDFDLPPGLVAQYPAAKRDTSRLMVVPGGGPVEHRRFGDLSGLLRAGDVLVVNESRVFPARLLGTRPSGGAAEVLLLRPQEDAGIWSALVRPGSKLRAGRTVAVAPELSIDVLEVLASGERLVRLVTDLDPVDAIDRFGRIPLPPYINRADEAVDHERYQTVYAAERGSVAAPTAGLHFTDALLDEVRALGVVIAPVTLHVGVGTFRPVEVDDPSDHPMHEERYIVPDSTVQAVAAAKAVGGRVWAVGTTAARTLESSVDPAGRLSSGSGETRLFIRPGFDYRVVDGLITNFHLPRSTLLMLVAAFRGYAPVMAAYRAAVAEGYRFFSYGDAMVLPPITPR
jgi:S-adenosylmethionine:tRNA ribosyltransferase-isomerase